MHLLKGKREIKSLTIGSIRSLIHVVVLLFSLIKSVKRVDEYTRSSMKMELDLAPRKSRRYYKYHTPGKWFKKAKAVGKIKTEKATMVFDSDAEISIIDTAFTRKVGCAIEESRTQECVGIGENA